jgi:RNA polymerase sigma factor (sigma-70 family)
MVRPELLLHQIHRFVSPQVATDVSDRDLLKRFVGSRDEAAFAALVRRHGPLVLNVCRRLLRHEQDAEDVFQATFLLLARKADSVGWRASVAPWLHAVAHRLALKARAGAARRRQCEQRLANEPATIAAEDLSWREAVAILEEELGRLPERYRAPLLLCCWEGKARDEAARLLGWTVGTVKGRLERGREVLRKRLLRRGVAMSAGSLAVAVARGGVPAALAAATVKLALAAVNGAAGVVPPAVAALAGATLAATRVRVAGVLAVILLATGAGVWAHQAWAVPQSAEARLDQSPAAPGGGGADEAELVAAPPAPPEKSPPEKPPAPLPWPRADSEGTPLPAGAAQRFGSARLRQAGPMRQAAFSGDGKLLTTSAGPQDWWVHVWDAATGKEVQRIDVQASGLALSPSGELLAVAGAAPSDGRGLHFWNMKTGALEKNRRPSLTGKPHLLSFSADGEHIYAADDHSVSAWKVDGGKFLWRVGLAPRGATALAAGNLGDAGFVAVAAAGNVHYITTAGKDVVLAEGKGGDEFTAVAIGGGLLAAGTKRGEIHLWEPDARGHPRAVRSWRKPIGRVTALNVAQTRDGPRLAVVSTGLKGIEVRTWDPRKGEELTSAKLDDPPDYKAGTGPEKVALSPDGKRVSVTDGVSPRVRLWDTATGKELFATVGHAGPVRHVTLLADGKTVASVGAEGVLLWTVGKDDRPRRAARSSRPSATQFAISHDGRAVATTSFLGGIELWDTATGKTTREINVAQPVLSASFAPDGNSLAFGTPEGVHLWTLAERSPHRLGEQRVPVPALAFSRDGRRLATVERNDGGRDGIVFWDIAEGKRLRTWAGPEGTRVELLAFDPAGGVLAVAGQGGDAVTLYDVVGGREPRRCRRPDARIHSLAFARGGRLLVAGDEDGLTLWEAASGAVVLYLAGHAGAVNSVAASADGNRLVSGGADTTVLLWDLAAAWKETAPKLLRGKQSPGPDELCRDLRDGGADAYRALWALAAERDRAMPALRKDLLKPGTRDDDARIDRLIDQLSDADSAVRGGALTELRQLGAQAEPAVRGALARATSDKLRARLRGLLAELELDGAITPADALHAIRAVDLLELIGTAEARKLLEVLARDGRSWWLREEARAALARQPTHERR